MAFWDGNEYLIMALTVIVIVVGTVVVWWVQKPKDASGYTDSSKFCKNWLKCIDKCENGATPECVNCCTDQ